MSDFNPREPIRLSDIDNLLEDSIFTSSNGAKLAEYLRKKRGTAGRVRLQNIFEQVAANIPKPIFNFDMDSSDPNPLPDSPHQPAAVAVNDAGESSASAPIAGTSAPVQNGNDLINLIPVKPGEPVLTPLVVVQDLKIASPKATSRLSDAGAINLGRQALLNQYHRTNMAKCELLRQITSSTPKPEAAASLSRISAFTTSISPITEADSPRVAELRAVAPPAAVPPLEAPIPEAVVLLHVPPEAVLPIDPVPPPQILAPCSQTPTQSTPKKVIVISTPAMPDPPSPKMIIPETPSPAKEVAESPKVAHQILPRKLSETFNHLQKELANESNEDITSDESEPVGADQAVPEKHPVEQEQQPMDQETSTDRDKSMEQDKSMDLDESTDQEPSMEQDNSMDQSQSTVEDQEPSIEAEQPVNHTDMVKQPIDDKQTPVNQEQPVPRDISVPKQGTENSFITKSILKDSLSLTKKKRHTFRVSFSQQLVQQREISPAPSIPEAYYSSSSDDDSSDLSEEEEFEDCEFQVIDEVYSDDGECDPEDIEENYNTLVRDDVEKQMEAIHQRIPSPLIDVVDDAPVQWYESRTPRKSQPQNENQILAPATCAKDNKTDLQLVDIITDWDDEDDDEEVEREDQAQSPEKESPLTPVDIPETQPSTQNETVCSPMDITNMEDTAERLVELPPPMESFNGTVELNCISSPDRAITPPTQFTDSAKRRFLEANEEALISRLQSELPPPSQEAPAPPDTPERVSETLVDIAQSFRDQPPPPVVIAPARKTIIPTKKPRRPTVVDPATNSYFEAVVEPFAHPNPVPAAKAKKNNQLTTAQKRKLYASSNGLVKPLVESSAAIRNFKIIVQKLRADNYSSEKLTNSDRATIERAINNVKSDKLQSNDVGAKGVGEKTDVETESEKNSNEQPTSTQPVQQKQPAMEPPDKSSSDTQSENSEPAFAGFDDFNDLKQQLEILRKTIDKDTHNDVHPQSSEDKVLETERNTEEDLQPVQNKRPGPKAERNRRVPRNLKTKQLSGPVKKMVENPLEHLEELSNERLTSNEEQDATDTNVERITANPEENIVEKHLIRVQILSNERLNSNEVKGPPDTAVGSGKVTKKMKNNPKEQIVARPFILVEKLSAERLALNEKHTPSGESSTANTNRKNNPEEKIVETDLVRVEKPSNDRLTSDEEQGPPDTEGERSRTTTKTRSNPTVKNAAAERADVRSDEILAPIEAPGPPVTDVEDRRNLRRKKRTEGKAAGPNRRHDPSNAIDVPISTSSEGHSDERLNPACRVHDVHLASLPEVRTTKSLDQNHEEERIISRTPLDTADVPASEAKRTRGRPKKVKPGVEPTAVRTEPESNSKMVVSQPDEANSVETTEISSSELASTSPPAGTLPSASNEISKDVDKDAQSLPFKKRKDRMFSDDEPPELAPYGNPTPVASNDHIPPLLSPIEPVPSTSKRRMDGKTRDVHEKYTTEKPEKKLSRFYRDVDDADETWLPNKKSLKDHYNRQLRKKAVASTRKNARKDVRKEETEPICEVRRGTRIRRLAEAVIKRNPSLRSIHDKPNYRQLTDEEFAELAREANRRAAERNQKGGTKPKTISSYSTNVAPPDSRKRVQEDPQDPITTKRNRPDDGVVLSSQDEQPRTIEPSPSATDSDRTSSTEKMQAYSWMLKLMQPNAVQCRGQANSELIVGGMHYSQEHLSCSERNGIQYSFYLHSNAENYGFMRFAPSAVKKLTITEKFLLKFLILEGNLSIKLNGQNVQVKGGDFLMLPENSTYAIQNGKEVSLIFMIKLCPSMCEA